ncbi:hypothetical protein AC241_30645 (plasmid) [Bacillus thuringiensis]|nr:hypothetical protein AC241_30645 [Bacillus thuringiensis]
MSCNTYKIPFIGPKINKRNSIRYKGAVLKILKALFEIRSKLDKDNIKILIMKRFQITVIIQMDSWYKTASRIFFRMSCDLHMK